MAIKTLSGNPSASALRLGYRTISVGVALIAIWGAATIMAVYSPDLITGSNHEHLQLAVAFAWPLAAIATGMVLLAAGVTRRATEVAGAWAVYALLVLLAWGGAAVASVFGAPMVTGTDPTTIPLAVLIAPLFAVLVTAYASIYIAGASADS
ncbi:MAG TPA: hypothetical protein VFR33_12205 [Candidatus Dormibacteraeota bacterium]|nr:hypothetical protein [Candidatus Dormibacteraeota bacterium]